MEAIKVYFPEFYYAINSEQTERDGHGKGHDNPEDALKEGENFKKEHPEGLTTEQDGAIIYKSYTGFVIQKYELKVVVKSKNKELISAYQELAYNADCNAGMNGYNTLPLDQVQILEEMHTKELENHINKLTQNIYF